jgi:DisA bacterial checkpoint controller nucleotide-binding
MKENSVKEIEEKIIEVGLRIARRGEGALIVFGKAKFKPLVEQKVPPFNIVDNLKLLESLALIDGAVIINHKGVMENYGVMIQSERTMKGFGTRHSAGLNASLVKGTTAFVISEEDKKIRVFKDGKIILQVDALEKGIEKRTSEIGGILASIGAGTIGTLGLGVLIPNFGLTLIPGVLIFGSTYFLLKKLKDASENKKLWSWLLWLF